MNTELNIEFMNAMHDVVIVLSTDLRIKFLNVAAENFYSKSNLVLKNSSYEELKKMSNMSPNLEDERREFLNERGKITLEISGEMQGTHYDFQWTILDMRDEIVLIGRNVTTMGKKNVDEKNFQNHLINISAHMPGNFYWKNKNGYYLGCNKQLLETLNFNSMSDILGRTDHDLWPEQAETLRQHDEIVMKEETLFTFEEEVVLANGGRRYFVVVKMPLRDENGNITGVLGNSLDITERKKREERLLIANNRNFQNYLEEIAPCIPGNFYWKDNLGRYLGCNNAVLNILNFQSASDIVGKTDYDLWPNQAEFISQHDQIVMKTGIAKNFEEEITVPPDGMRIYFAVTKIPLRDPNGNIIGILGNSLDITDRKKMEEQLILANKKAEIANNLKTEFVQNMQHDIRTPASGIYGYLRIMAEREMEPEQKTILEALAKASEELLKICNEALDFNSVEYGLVPILSKKFNVIHLVESVITLNFPAAKGKGLELSLHADPDIQQVIKGDDVRLRRILINLIGNSVKFTHKGSVVLELRQLRSNDKEVLLQFTISDTGIGIPLEKKPFIFEKFVRGTRSNQAQYKGTGLGLWIVKKFVEELGGEIDVQSQPDKGTIFTVTLPFQKPLAQELLSEFSLSDDS